MNAWLGGDSSVTWPAAVASLGCFLVNLGLLRRVFHLHKAGTEMAGSVRARAGLSVRDLSPNIFAIVMAAGIVSLAVHGAGYSIAAHVLFWLNVGLYALLGALLLIRVLRCRGELAADLGSSRAGTAHDRLKPPPR